MKTLKRQFFVTILTVQNTFSKPNFVWSEISVKKNMIKDIRRSHLHGWVWSCGMQNTFQY